MALNNDVRVSVKVNGVDQGVWDKRSGGKMDSSEKKYYKGGGRTVAPVSEGGTPEPENVTCERATDGAPTPLKTLKRWCGRKVPALVTELDLDPDGNVVGEGETYIGTLKAAWKSDADSENKDEKMMAIEVSVTDIV